MFTFKELDVAIAWYDREAEMYFLTLQARGVGR